MNSTSIERKQLVAFGAVMAVAAIFLGWLFELPALYAVGALFALLAAAAPRALVPLYKPWMRLAEALGWLNTRILLILIFYLVVTPIGLVLRLFRRSPLAIEEKNGSFWAEPSRHSWGDKHFEKQF